MPHRKRVVVLGGGTGTFTVLSGLKHQSVDLAAVVSVADNGGSTGILRDELGVLPPGDIRQCLVALAEEGSVLRQLFMYRFRQGILAGHNAGNIFLSALEKISGDSLSAVREAQKILRVKGRVIPVSRRASNLVAELEDGTIVRGEHNIDEVDGPRAAIKRCFLSPSITANPEALQAIRQADAIVLGPGDVFTSLVPVLLVKGVVEALAKSRGKKILVINLATKQGQTDGFTTQAFYDVVSKYIAPARLTGVVINSAKPSPSVMRRYAKKGEHLVIDTLKNPPCSVARVSLLAQEIIRPQHGDVLRRSLLRHDPDKLAKIIMKMLS